MDAAPSAAQLWRPTADDPEVPASSANIHPGAAHAQGRLRAVPRLQGDSARLHPSDRADVRVRQLRGAVVRWAARQVQRPQHRAPRGLRRRFPATRLRHQNETGPWGERELPLHAGPQSLVNALSENR